MLEDIHQSVSFLESVTLMHLYVYNISWDIRSPWLLRAFSISIIASSWTQCQPIVAQSLIERNNLWRHADVPSCIWPSKNLSCEWATWQRSVSPRLHQIGPLLNCFTWSSMLSSYIDGHYQTQSCEAPCFILFFVFEDIVEGIINWIIQCLLFEDLCNKFLSKSVPGIIHHSWIPSFIL